MQTTTGRNRGPAARAAARVAVLALAWLPAAAAAAGVAQDDRPARVDELARVLGMTAEEVEALGLSSDEIQVLLEGYTEETVVVGTRARPRTVAESPVPVDVLSSADLTSQGAVNLQDQLRNIVPSFNVNTQPVAANVGLPLGATGFANLSLEYGGSGTAGAGKDADGESPCRVPRAPTRRQRAALGCSRQPHVDRCPPRKPASSNGADSWRVGWAAGRGAGDRARSLCRLGIPANLTMSG